MNECPAPAPDPLIGRHVLIAFDGGTRHLGTLIEVHQENDGLHITVADLTTTPNPYRTVPTETTTPKESK